MIVAHWVEGAYQVTEVSLVVADTMEEIARAFAQEVCAFCNQPGNAILGIHAGCWSESHGSGRPSRRRPSKTSSSRATSRPRS